MEEPDLLVVVASGRTAPGGGAAARGRTSPGASARRALVLTAPTGALLLLGTFTTFAAALRALRPTATALLAAPATGAASLTAARVISISLVRHGMTPS